MGCWRESQPFGGQEKSCLPAIPSLGGSFLVPLRYTGQRAGAPPDIPQARRFLEPAGFLEAAAFFALCLGGSALTAWFCISTKFTVGRRN